MDPQVPDPERAVNIEQGLGIEPRVEGQQPKDNHWISILAMAIFILFSLGVVVFLYYQNQQLKNMLANYQSQPTSSPTPSATADPTANWKVSANPEWGISFKYPTTWSEFTTSGGEYFSTDSVTKINLRLSKGVFYNNMPSDPYSSAFSATAGQSVGNAKENVKIADLLLDRHQAVLISMDHLLDTQDVPSYSYVYIIKDNNSLYTLNFWQDGNESKTNILNNKSTFDQILSTFKFLGNATTTPAGPLVPGTGCLYQGKTYQNGVSVPSGDKCNTCSCENGKVACTTMACL